MKDFYFHGERKCKNGSWWIIFSLTNAQITTHITQGKLRQALVGDAGLAEGTDVLFC